MKKPKKSPTETQVTIDQKVTMEKENINLKFLTLNLFRQKLPNIRINLTIRITKFALMAKPGLFYIASDYDGSLILGDISLASMFDTLRDAEDLNDQLFDEFEIIEVTKKQNGKHEPKQIY